MEETGSGSEDEQMPALDAHPVKVDPANLPKGMKPVRGRGGRGGGGG